MKNRALYEMYIKMVVKPNREAVLLASAKLDAAMTEMNRSETVASEVYSRYISSRHSTGLVTGKNFYGMLRVSFFGGMVSVVIVEPDRLDVRITYEGVCAYEFEGKDEAWLDTLLDMGAKCPVFVSAGGEAEEE